MNGDRSNHQGRVKVAEKAAPPSRARGMRKASRFPLSHHVPPSPPWGRGAGGEGVDTANAQRRHPGSQLSGCDPQTDGTRFATPSPGPPRLKRTPAAGHPLPQGGEGKSRRARKSQQECRNSRGRSEGRPYNRIGTLLPLLHPRKLCRDFIRTQSAIIAGLARCRKSRTQESEFRRQKAGGNRQ